MSGQYTCPNKSSRAFVGPFPVAEYRARLLRQCLNYNERPTVVSSLPTPSTVPVPANSGLPVAQADVVDLLDFLQQEAVPYEVRAPPYAQILGEKGRRWPVGVDARNAIKTSQRATAAAGPGALRSGRDRITQRKQHSTGNSNGAGAANRTSNRLTTSGTTAAETAALKAPSKPRARSQVVDLPSVADKPSSAAAGSIVEPIRPAGGAASIPGAAAHDPDQATGDLITTLPPDATPAAPHSHSPGKPRGQATSETAAPPPQATAFGSAASGPPPTAGAAAQPLTQGQRDPRPGADAAVPPATVTRLPSTSPGSGVTRGSFRPGEAKAGGSGPAGPVIVGDDNASSGSGAELRGSRAGPAAAGAAAWVATRALGSDSGSNSGSAGGGGGAGAGAGEGPVQATPSPEEARRAAVLWQWRHFLEPRKAPPGPLAAPSPEPLGAPRVATITDTAAPAPAPPSSASSPFFSLDSISGGAAEPPATGGAAPKPPAAAIPPPPTPVGAAAASRPPPVVQVPGLAAPPPPRLAPNAATGEKPAGAAAVAPAVAAAAAEAAAPVSQAARVPPALLPLTLQGRIALMEAAMAAAAAAAAAKDAAKDAATPRRAVLDSRGGGGSSAAGAGRVEPGAGRVAAAAAPAGAAAGASVAARGLVPPGAAAAAAAGGRKGALPGPAVTSAQKAGLAAAAASASMASPEATEAAAQRHKSPSPPAANPAAPRAPKPGAAAAAAASSGAADGTAAAAAVPSASGDPAAVVAAVAPSPPSAPIARAAELLARLVSYLPSGREDGPALLAPYQRYVYGPYQEAAVAAAEHPELLLRPLGLQQLSYIAAAYAAAGHRHEPFLRELAAAAAEKMAAARRGAGRVTARGATTPSRTAPLTFRTACVLLTALARLRYRDAQLTAALGRWLAAALRSGTVVPRAKWKGTWLAAALWAYATLERTPAREEEKAAAVAAAAAANMRPPPAAAAAAAADVSAAGAVLFAEAAEAIRVDPGWIHLMDCREALWALWALKVAAAMYEPTAGGAAAPSAAPVTAMPGLAAPARVSYTPQPLVELQLLGRTASQVDQLDPGHLAEAYAVAAEAGFGADRDMLAALRRCTLARVAAVRPQPLAVMVAALAVIKVQDVVWLTALAAACRNQMINMKAEQIVVVLHSFSSALRFYHLPLFHAAAVMCSLPGFARLGAMAAGDLVRLAAAYAGVGHYEGVLLHRMAERVLTLGSVATPWQRASVLQSCARLAFRATPLLRAVTAEAFPLAAPPPPAKPAAAAAPPPLPALPPAQLAAVAAVCGQMRFRPPGLLAALHTTRAAEWPRLGLVQRAALCWALLVLTGGLANSGGGGTAAAATVQRRGAVGTAASPDSQHQQRRHQRHQQQLGQALCEYLGALAATDWRSWPSTDPHHWQLLVACSVLTGRLQRQQQPEAGADEGEAAAAAAAGPGFAPAVSSPALRAAVERLPAAATRRALAAQHRLRQAALGPWAAAVGDVVRQVVEGAAAADAAAGADGAAARPWLALGPPARGPAAAAAAEGRWRVRGGAVTQGLMMCGGALGIDVGVEVEVEEAVSVGDHLAGNEAGDTAQKLDSDGAAGGGAESVVRQRRRRVRIALELCAPPPPGAGAAAAAAGTCGGGVVRNSRWLLSGAAALRGVLLVGLGWRVVPVRERTWKALRSPEQRHRAVEALVRQAVLQEVAVATAASSAAAAASGRQVVSPDGGEGGPGEAMGAREVGDVAAPEKVYLEL